jgi:hypothetical protein
MFKNNSRIRQDQHDAPKVSSDCKFRLLSTKAFSRVIVPTLIIIFIIIELSLRVIGRVSLTAKKYIDGVIDNHPIIFGSFLMAIMMLVVWISFSEYSKKKTKSNLAKLIVWLSVTAVFLIYGRIERMIVYIIFAVFLAFAFAYYFAFEYCRYKMARMLAEGLGGKAVFKLGRSYMRRAQDGVEERAWVVPDDKMAWGSILSILKPDMGVLFLQRDKGPDFRFHIEPKTNMFLRTISLGALKEAEFNVPQLDESLRLRTNNHPEAERYFCAPEKQQALTALFLAGFTRLEGNRGAIMASMKGISTENLDTEKIDLFFKHLRSL